MCDTSSSPSEITFFSKAIQLTSSSLMTRGFKPQMLLSTACLPPRLTSLSDLISTEVTSSNKRVMNRSGSRANASPETICRQWPQTYSGHHAASNGSLLKAREEVCLHCAFVSAPCEDMQRLSCGQLRDSRQGFVSIQASQSHPTQSPSASWL